MKNQRYLPSLRFPLAPNKKRLGDFVGSDHSETPLSRSPV